MIPNNAGELLLFYLLSSIKNPSFLAQNLSFCQLDVWDSVLLINCPGQEVFEFILKRKKVLATAISKQLSVKLVHIRWQKEVVDFLIDDFLSEQNNRPSAGFQIRFDIASSVKQSIKPVLAAKLDGQILFTYSPQFNENFSFKGIYLSEIEASRLAEAVESHGWVDGYRLKLDSYESQGIFTTIRARYAKDGLLNQLVLLIQVLNTESLGVVSSRDIA